METIVAIAKSHPGLVVLRETDESCSELFWLLDMSTPEFERWWQKRQEFWWAVTEEDRKFWQTIAGDPELAKVYGEEIPALRPPMDLPGKFLPCWTSVGQEPKAAISLWMQLYESKRHHYCRLCCDSDSFLLAPDGRHIYHQGYRGQRVPDAKPFFNGIPLP